MSGSSQVAVRPVLGDDDDEAFFELPRRVMRDVEQWRPDPHNRERPAFDPQRNPLTEHAEVVRYVAERDDRIVGRIAAWIDDRTPSTLGFFGFYEAMDDLEAGRALVWAARDWCRSRGRSRVVGPINFWPVWSAGVPVDGYERPNVIGIQHGRCYYSEHFEAAGASVAAKLHVWTFGQNPVPHPAVQIGHAVAARDDVELRRFDPRSSADWATVTELYRTCYVDDECYFDVSAGELKLMAGRDVDPAISALAFVDGEPAGMCIGLRNTPETALRVGRVIPPDSIQRVWHTGPRRARSWRQWLFGVAPPFRGRAVGGLGTALYVWLCESADEAGYEWCEAAYTRNDGAGLDRAMRVLGATRDRTYHLFQANLETEKAD